MCTGSISDDKAEFGIGNLWVWVASFLRRNCPAQTYCGAGRVHLDPGSPGQLFRLDENSVVEHVATLGELTEGKIRMQETAGLRQIYIETEADGTYDQMAYSLLEAYYG